jgi:hypothetical protein
MTEQEPPSSLPASSATFALTLDQNVSRDVRRRVEKLVSERRSSGLVSVVASGVTVVAGAAAAVTEPFLILLIGYAGLFTLPIAFAVHGLRRRAAAVAEQLNQSRDVAFVGVDGLVFFSDDGFFLERRGGFMPWGVKSPTPRRYETAFYDQADASLRLVSSAGYETAIYVPRGWTYEDTARVQAKMDAFADDP